MVTDVVERLTPGVETPTPAVTRIYLPIVLRTEPTLPPLAGPMWPMFAFDARRTGYTPVDGPTTDKLAWTVPLGPVIDSASPVVGPDGVVYAPDDKSLVAVGRDGVVKWRYAGGMRSAPALSADGQTVYTLTNGRATVVALVTQTGAVRWSRALGGIVSYSSFAVGADGAIYVGTRNGMLHALNPDGTIRWQYTGPTPEYCGIEAPPAVDAAGNAYVLQNCYGLTAIDPQGHRRWIEETDPIPYATFGWSAPLILPDGAIFHGAAFSAADGSIKWQVNYPREELGYFMNAALSPDGSTLYRAFSGWLLAIDATSGAIRWQRQVESRVQTFGGAPLLARNNVLYVMGEESVTIPAQIYAYSSVDGALLWKHELQTAFSCCWGPTSPALGPDGTLYIIGGTVAPAGQLYAFRP